MINYEISLLEIEKLYFLLGLTIFAVVVMCIFIKVLWKALDNQQVMIEKINRDNELKYENLVDVVCPQQIKLKQCKKCTSSRQDCWKEYFISRVSPNTIKGKGGTFSIKGGNENANSTK